VNINRAIFKIFGVSKNDCIQASHHLPILKVVTESRRLKFVDKRLH